MSHDPTIDERQLFPPDNYNRLLMQHNVALEKFPKANSSFDTRLFLPPTGKFVTEFANRWLCSRRLKKIEKLKTVDHFVRMHFLMLICKPELNAIQLSQRFRFNLRNVDFLFSSKDFKVIGKETCLLRTHGRPEFLYSKMPKTLLMQRKLNELISSGN